MGTSARSLWVAVLALLFSATAGQAQQAANGADYRASVARAAGDLARQIEWLQDAIYNQPQRQQGRDLWDSSEKVNQQILALQKQLRSGAPRKALYVTFSLLDTQVGSLLGDLPILGERLDPLHRAADRVRTAENELHFAITAGDTSDGLRPELLKRQTLALIAAAQDLEKLGAYLFAGKNAWKTIGGDLVKLRQAAEDFLKTLEARPDNKQLPLKFAKVQQSWQDLTGDYSFQSQPPSVLWQNYAARLDGIYGRLYGLVGIKGNRATLVPGS